jgi:hypothetical protein
MCGKFSRRNVCLGGLAALALSACGKGNSSSSGTLPPSTADEWLATKHDDPLQDQMQVFYNGSDNGMNRIVYFQHTKDGIATMPYVAGIDAAGKIQLQFLNSTDNPFGASLALGPAYWRNDVTGDSYQANPVIKKLEITGSMHSGPLELKLTGSIGDAAIPDFDVAWDITMYQPQLNGGKMYLDVTQTATCARNIILSAAKQAEYRHFMIAMLRSMYVDSDTHYSNAARYVKSDNTLVNKNLVDMLASGLLFDGLTPSFKVGEMTHTDDLPENTPNVRMQLLDPMIPAEFQWQGAYILDPNPTHDNAEAGFNHKTAPLIWAVGDKHISYYRIIASDNPLDPSAPDADPN